MKKKLLSHEAVCFQMLDFETSNSKLEVSKSSLWIITLEEYSASEGAVSHNVLYYQPLPISRYRVRFYANNYFEYIPMVSTAFKVNNFPLTWLG